VRPTGGTVTAAISAVVVLAGAIASSAMLRSDKAGGSQADLMRPVWSEASWPFPVDPWGKGKAFRCKPADCGREINVYLRAKLGFCNCTTGIADDVDVDRMGDLDLIGREVAPLGASRPITVGVMDGRSRSYTFTGSRKSNEAMISILFNERCDMVAATVLFDHERPEAVESTVINFLNSGTILKWTEATLGL
jgi:hypothetical protein